MYIVFVCVCVYIYIYKECEMASFARLHNLFACNELTPQFSHILLGTLSFAHVVVALFGDLFRLMTCIGITLDSQNMCH